jgi:hypothetical protein
VNQIYETYTVVFLLVVQAIEPNECVARNG